MKTVLEVAESLARSHRREDPATQAIYLAPAPADDEVRLVEVSGSLGSTGEVLPFRFTARPDQGIDYPSVVVLLSLDEWQDLLDGKLKLPPGWGEPSILKKIGE